MPQGYSDVIAPTETLSAAHNKTGDNGHASIPSRAGFFTLRRLWLPEEGDAFDGLQGPRYLLDDGGRRRATIKRDLGVTLLSYLTVKQLAQHPEYLDPTEETMTDIADKLPQEIHIHSMRASLIRRRPDSLGQYHVGLFFRSEGKETIRSDQSSIVARLNAKDVTEKTNPHMNIFVTKDLAAAHRLTIGLRRSLKRTGYIVLGKPYPVKAASFSPAPPSVNNH